MNIRSQHGVALITVLLMITLLSLIGLAAMQSAAVQTRIARAQQQMDYARSVADAGLQQARTYINTGNSNYQAHGSLPYSTTHTVDSNTASIVVSPSSGGIYPVSSTLTLSSGSSANLYAQIRRPMGAAWLAGRLKDLKGTISGTDLCGTQHIAGLATSKSSLTSTFKNSSDASNVTTSGPNSIVYNMSTIDIADIITKLENAGVPTTTVTNGKNYNTAHGDPDNGDTNCNPSTMQAVLIKDDLDPNSGFKGCGLLMVEGDAAFKGNVGQGTGNHWRGVVLATGAITLTNSAWIQGAAISGTSIDDQNEITNQGAIRWCSTAANWANDLTRETGAQLWFSHWNNINP